MTNFLGFKFFYPRDRGVMYNEFGQKFVGNMVGIVIATYKSPEGKEFVGWSMANPSDKFCKITGRHVATSLPRLQVIPETVRPPEGLRPSVMNKGLTLLSEFSGTSVPERVKRAASRELKRLQMLYASTANKSNKDNNQKNLVKPDFSVPSDCYANLTYFSAGADQEVVIR
jgi:hypothetical protein